MSDTDKIVEKIIRKISEWRGEYLDEDLWGDEEWWD